MADPGRPPVATVSKRKPGRPVGGKIGTGQRHKLPNKVAQLVASGDLPPSVLQDAASLLVSPTGKLIVNANRPPFRRDEQDKIRLKLRKHLQTRLGLPHELPTLPGVQSLSIATRYLDGGRARFIEFVQAAMLNGNEPATKWLIVYADLTPTEQMKVSYDDICAASGVKPSEIVAAITATAVEIGVDVGNLVAALTHPQVVAAGVAAAKRLDGIEDRRMLFSHQGFIPVPKNTQTVVNVNASASAQAAAQAQASGGVPSFADDLKQVGQGRVVARALPAAPADDDQITFDQESSPADAEEFDYGDVEAGELVAVYVGEDDGA